MSALEEKLRQLSMSTEEEFVRYFKALVSQDIALPVAAMNTLVHKIQASSATTWMQLEQELRAVIAALKTCNQEDLGGRTNISLGSGCDLFMKYVTRAFNLDNMEFDACKIELVRRGEIYTGLSMSSRSQIADIGHSFIQEESTIMVHGFSRVVNALIIKAAQTKYFNVIVTEGRPGNHGIQTAKIYADAGIPTKIILDNAVGAVMESVDMVLVGAEGVMENGGIVNKIGTYQLALVAEASKKPFYVAVESYKFARMYPLSQRDTRDILGKNNTKGNRSRTTSGNYESNNAAAFTNYNLDDKSLDVLVKDLPANVSIDLPAIDFTPAKLITLLITDLGVLTPAAVSDELIRLYQ